MRVAPVQSVLISRLVLYMLRTIYGLSPTLARCIMTFRVDRHLSLIKGLKEAGVNYGDATDINAGSCFDH